jgi:hypothetical protein
VKADLKYIKMEFNLLGLSTNINVEKIGLELLKVHNSNEGMKTMLAFGMLDAGVMEEAEKTILEGVTKNIDPLDVELFKPKFKSFMNEVMKEISIIIYQNATMVV